MEGIYSAVIRPLLSVIGSYMATLSAMTGLGDLGLLLIGGAILGVVYLYIRWRMQYGHAISDNNWNWNNCGDC